MDTYLQRGNDFRIISIRKIADQFDSIPISSFVEEMVEGVSLLKKESSHPH